MNAAEQLSSDVTDDLQQSDVGLVRADHDGQLINDASNDANLDQGVRAAGINAELANKWLVWQCKMIADVITGVVYDANGNMLAMRPANGPGADKLAIAGQQAFENNKPVITTEITFGSSHGRLGDIIATPVKDGEKVLGYVALLMTPRPQSRQNVVLQLLQWGGFWLEALSQMSDGIQIEAGAFTQTLMGAVLEHSNSNKACMEIAARLCDRLNCDRVTIGLKQGVVVRVECISHLASFDARTQLVRRLEAAMEECLDQNAVITLPKGPTTEPVIDKSHGDFQSNHSENSCIASFPLHGKESLGAITLERASTKPFDADTIQWCESVLNAVGPVVELKRFEERSILSKAKDSFRKSCQSLMGPSNLKLKIAGVATAAVLLLASIFNGNHIVSSPAYIEGAQAQIIAAPISGFVKTSEVRAGDKVEEGQLLATLDDRSLQLELRKWQGEDNKIKKAYQEALAKKARTELSILRAKSEQIEAERALVQERIARTELRAPYDGYVTSGDLSQSLGTPVDIGDILFEVAPSEEYKVIVKVDEREMAGVDNDKSGKVVIAALPNDPIPFQIEQVVPLAISGEGKSYFRVEAAFQQATPDLRPGMEGVARIDMGKRKLLWIWTHKLVDRIKLWLWSVGW